MGHDIVGLERGIEIGCPHFGWASTRRVIGFQVSLKRGSASIQFFKGLALSGNVEDDKVKGLSATVEPVKGITLSGGLYDSKLKVPNLLTNADGQTVESKYSSPEAKPDDKMPDTRVMLNVDLMKLEIGPLRRAFGGK